MLNIKQMCKTLASHGVTSFVPTLISDHIDSIFTAFDNFSNLHSDNFFQFGAEPVGLHIEGPFINIKKRGSQPAAGIIPIDLGLTKELIAAAKGSLKIWTFAPELELAIPFIELLCENNIVPSMGHSNANEKEVLAAVDAGARRCTHLFNGMSPFHQRNISLTSVALTDDRISVELILDGKHLHPRIVDLTCRAKPSNRIIGVSDAIQGAGLDNDGQYHIGKSGISVKDGLAKTSEGILSGTTLTLETGWHHLITYSNLEDTAAAACFTTNPANDLGLTNYGEITPGKVANISFFDRKTNRARLTICQGKVVYDSTL
jgi:N-acetylglucosamine-6-phosphate deacetylase